MRFHFLIFTVILNINAEDNFSVTPSPPSPIPEPPTLVDFMNGFNKSAAIPLFSKSHVHRRKVRKNPVKIDKAAVSKCDDEELRQLMLSSITPILRTSKMLIFERIKREFGVQFDVICASGLFSYYVEASTHCEVTINDVTCLAYKSSKPN